jgi:rhamnose utilization protein RhaD (predicted bifunctional aldolase and dehydrogenase)
MQSPKYKLSTRIKEYCAEIADNPDLVQGPGGNISWKDNNTLYIKASGKWLADAKKEEIFVSVDLLDLNEKISSKLFAEKARVIDQSDLRPSIETMLHALLPHKIVLHLHAVEILALLIRKNPFKDIKKFVDPSIKWIFVEYYKPGDILAEKISMQYQKRVDIDCIFLKNHGVVIGGDSIERVDWILKKLILVLKSNLYVFEKDIKNNTLKHDFSIPGYSLSGDRKLNLLATNRTLIKRLKEDWALYPDHIVFLGAQACIIEKDEDLSIYNKDHPYPCFIFVLGVGVYESESISKAQQAQLNCYFNVVSRQKPSEKLTSLNEIEVTDLLNWDAEKYRQNFSSVKIKK